MKILKKTSHLNNHERQKTKFITEIHIRYLQGYTFCIDIKICHYKVNGEVLKDIKWSIEVRTCCHYGDKGKASIWRNGLRMFATDIHSLLSMYTFSNEEIIQNKKDIAYFEIRDFEK